MTRSLMIGITGLRTHQQKLDVVANNLANMNTTGFKSQSTVFSDLMYQSLRQASGPITGNGGTNSVSIGSGSQLAHTNRNFSQGTLETTGQYLDFAMQGDGFFTVKDASGEIAFTRDGSFGLDATGRLVDPATGFYVQRFGSTGEPIDGEIGFQDPADDAIRVPLGASVPGLKTSNLDFVGILPSDASPPVAQVISTTFPFETAGGAALATDVLNDLTINASPYQAGDLLELRGTNPDGTFFSVDIPADTSTMGDMVTAINGAITDATASLAADGSLLITADAPGEANLGLIIRDAAGNVGGTAFSSNQLVTTTSGNSGDTHQLSLEVFDVLGKGHRVNFDFVKTSTKTWDINASMAIESGVLTDAGAQSLTFNDDGTFALIAGTSGTADPDIEILFTGQDTPQNIALDLSSLQHLATDFSLTQRQDGFPPGTIASVAVSAEGEMTALATNGREIKLAQLAVANFSNNLGLDAIGGNYFKQSLNSGEASLGPGSSSGRGIVIGGQLEGSNVDIAQEFTQLIVAQRGFSANARTLTIADEMLEELTNIVR